ncbi:pyocin knob domain-containing protein [Bradyrhizobium sp. RP6]|uniref:pyocin knob domain-containing protein n=1 Tax=Bradyrhizobium sp. RP6 TaxID=2489596 RepID=UPI000F548F77|nr:pyocin knob domain-containing protein [Bradyrhizobium sp. RP6]RQH15986.1 hypothetical protein EHH60_02005 [Bradyrhizobium sp. RP6]
MPNDLTTRGYPLPHPDNVAREDAQRIRDAIQTISEDIDSMAVEPPIASETTTGDVRLATAAEATAGTVLDAVPAVKRVKDMIVAAIDALKGGVGPAYDTLVEIADKLTADDTAISGILTALANRLRVDTSSQGLSASQQSNARINLDMEAFGPAGVTLANGTDLNTLTSKNGAYMGTALGNSPSSNGCTLWVQKWGVYVYQRLNAHDLGIVYERWYNGTTWTAWVKVFTAANVATAAAIRSKTGSDLITTDKAWDAAGFVDLGVSGSGNLNIDCNNGVRFRVVLTGNVTVNFLNPKDGQNVDVTFVQDATGGRTVSWNSNVRFPNGIAPTVATGANGWALVFTGVYNANYAQWLGAGWKLS